MVQYLLFPPSSSGTGEVLQPHPVVVQALGLLQLDRVDLTGLVVRADLQQNNT